MDCQTLQNRIFRKTEDTLIIALKIIQKKKFEQVVTYNLLEMTKLQFALVTILPPSNRLRFLLESFEWGTREWTRSLWSIQTLNFRPDFAVRCLPNQASIGRTCQMAPPSPGEVRLVIGH